MRREGVREWGVRREEMRHEAWGSEACGKPGLATERQYPNDVSLLELSIVWYAVIRRHSRRRRRDRVRAGGLSQLGGARVCNIERSSSAATLCVTARLVSTAAEHRRQRPISTLPSSCDARQVSLWWRRTCDDSFVFVHFTIFYSFDPLVPAGSYKTMFI